MTAPIRLSPISEDTLDAMHKALTKIYSALKARHSSIFGSDTAEKSATPEPDWAAASDIAQDFGSALGYAQNVMSNRWYADIKPETKETHLAGAQSALVSLNRDIAHAQSQLGRQHAEVKSAARDLVAGMMGMRHMALADHALTAREAMRLGREELKNTRERD